VRNIIVFVCIIIVKLKKCEAVDNKCLVTQDGIPLSFSESCLFCALTTSSPSNFPTDVPTNIPTDVPTNSPTNSPTTNSPTNSPTKTPTASTTCGQYNYDILACINLGGRNCGSFILDPTGGEDAEYVCQLCSAASETICLHTNSFNTVQGCGWSGSICESCHKYDESELGCNGLTGCAWTDVSYDGHNCYDCTQFTNVECDSIPGCHTTGTGWDETCEVLPTTANPTTVPTTVPTAMPSAIPTTVPTTAPTTPTFTTCGLTLIINTTDILSDECEGFNQCGMIFTSSTSSTSDIFEPDVSGCAINRYTQLAVITCGCQLNSDTKCFMDTFIELYNSDKELVLFNMKNYISTMNIGEIKKEESLYFITEKSTHQPTTASPTYLVGTAEPRVILTSMSKTINTKVYIMLPVYYILCLSFLLCVVLIIHRTHSNK